MGIRATISSTPGRVVSTGRNQSSSVRTVGVAPQPTTIVNNNYGNGGTLVSLADVDSGDANTGEALVYDANTQKFVVQSLPALNGGIF